MQGDAGPVDRAAEELYALDPDDFVERREALAKDLVAAGQRAAAKEVRALRRPTVVAWAANQLKRRDPEGVAALLDAGQRLREAQEAALAGGARGGGGSGGAALREATAERRRRLEPLLRVAVDALGDRAGTHRDELSATLLASSSDPEVGDLLRRGRLVREAVAASGFELFGLEPAEAPPPPSTRRETKGETTGDAPDTDGEAALRRAAAELRVAEARALALRLAEAGEEAEAELARAGAEAALAEAELATVEKALDRARTAAAAARAEADRAAEAAAAAQAALGRAEEALEATCRRASRGLDPRSRPSGRQ